MSSSLGELGREARAAILPTMDAVSGAPRAIFSGETASRGNEVEGEVGRLAKAATSPIAGTGPETRGGAYFGSRGSAAVIGEASGGERNDFVPGETYFGGGSGIDTTMVGGASGCERSDFRSGASYFGSGGSGFPATVVEDASGGKRSDFLRASCWRARW